MMRIETEIDNERAVLLRSRLRETNTAASTALRAQRNTPLDREVPLQLWAMDEQDRLIGGLDGHIWSRWLHVDLLWVDENSRGTGLGSRLLTTAEDLARSAHRCRASRVSTWDFQAPDFYRRFGYEVAGVVPDYPQGVTEYTLVKSL